MAINKEKNNEEITEEIIYDEDKGAELVKKLRAKLRACEKEKKEYLDGWQRLKADTINANKQQSEALLSVQKRSVSDLVYNLLPALDSFDIALQGESWDSIDANWKTGIEHVHSQLLKSLEDSGVTSFGKVGEIFDIHKHEAIAHIEGGESHTVAKIERRGYEIGGTILRAAQVVVYS